MPDASQSARPAWDRWQRRALSAGAISLALCVAGAAIGYLRGVAGPVEDRALSVWLFDRDQFLRSYLVAYLLFLGIPLGSLAILMVHHLTGGDWGWALRGVLEAAARTLPLVALLFLPLLFGLARLYPWAQWTADQIGGSEVLQAKSRYLNVPFFLARALGYFAVWLAVAHFLVRRSGERHGPGRPEPRRMRILSGPGLAVYGLTITFAAIDWTMSLEPMWYSTIYGPLFAAGQVLTAMAFGIGALVVFASPEERLTAVSPKHLRDLGSLLLAFVMLWAYMAFSQLMLIWAGNLPQEIPYYLKRLDGGWQWLALVLFLFQFALPFLLLLSKEIKQNPRALAAVAGTILAVRVVDLFWTTVPAYFPYQGLRLHWMDPLAIVGIGGLWLAMFIRELRRGPLLPEPTPVLKRRDMASHPQPPNLHGGYEQTDIRVGAVVGFGAGLALVLVFTLLGVAWLFSVFARTEDRQKRSDLPLVVDGRSGPSLPPEPTLEGIEPLGPATGGRAAFVVSTRDDLSRPLHWVDPDQQVAAIPIEDRRDPAYQHEFFQRFLVAKTLIVREGHTWQQAAQVLPSDANSGRPPKENQP